MFSERFHFQIDRLKQIVSRFYQPVFRWIRWVKSSGRKYTTLGGTLLNHSSHLRTCNRVKASFFCAKVLDTIGHRCPDPQVPWSFADIILFVVDSCHVLISPQLSSFRPIHICNSRYCTGVSQIPPHKLVTCVYLANLRYSRASRRSCGRRTLFRYLWTSIYIISACIVKVAFQSFCYDTQLL